MTLDDLRQRPVLLGVGYGLLRARSAARGIPRSVSNFDSQASGRDRHRDFFGVAHFCRTRLQAHRFERVPLDRYHLGFDMGKIPQHDEKNIIALE